MEGITVLDTFSAEPMLWHTGLSLLATGLCCFISSFILCRDGTRMYLSSFFLAVVFFIGGSIMILMPEGHQESYKVLISEDTKFIDFYDTYEIIEREDLTFIVRERK